MKLQATINEIVQETPRVRLVRITWPEVVSFQFKPGQWVGVWCDDFKGENNKPIRRAFSIASCPGEKFLELCVARGKSFSAFLQDLPVGAKVNVDGPYGTFWLAPAEKYLFIAGGTGIAPFRPMIHQALEQRKEVLLLYSMKTPSDFIYSEELELLMKDKNFKLIPTITVDNEFSSWTGERGRVQVLLNKYWKPGYIAYVCGPPGMVDEVVKKLHSIGQPTDKIKVDRWE